jgi:hypothetical protein
MTTSNARRRWPKPTTPEPDLEQLMKWLFEDECEATDGCTVKNDGSCPHGHPSWLLRLEFVFQPELELSTGS